MGSIKQSLAMTKYKIVPLKATGTYKFLALLISCSTIEFLSRSFSTYLDLILDYSRVVISSMSSSTMPFD